MEATKVFYESIVPEATLGKVDVYFLLRVAFGTRLVEEKIDYPCRVDAPGVVAPTLMIKNRALFDKLLNEYANKALAFYSNSGIYEEVLNYHNTENIRIGKVKLILTQLFANAMVEDFNDPIRFLRRRIDFIDNYADKVVNLGRSAMLDADLELIVNKGTLNDETPGEFIIRATDGDDKWISPRVRFGISEDTVYIYAIQNEDENKNQLGKKINRRLYKVGEGFDNLGEDENPKDITASFLVTLNMAINYFRSLGYEKIVVPSIMIVRWNAKRILLTDKYRRKRINDEDKRTLESKLDTIQNNLTNKMMRTFLRLTCHYNNIDIDALPFEVDSALHIRLNNEIKEKCNNQLLMETGRMVSNVSKNIEK